MRYTVVWVQAALDELTQLWIDARDKRKVAEAANGDDSELAKNPDQKGELDENDVRVLHVPPLEVAFLVLPDDRLVRVTRVQRRQ